MKDKIIESDENIPFGEVIYPSTRNNLHEVMYDKENPIGEPFFTQKYGLLVAVEDKDFEGCAQCAIYDAKKGKCGAATINVGSCSPRYREDGKEIIFKRVKDVKEVEA